MNVPKISVVMSVYNGEKFLQESIQSILNQTYEDFEFIIIDDYSEDSSFEIISGFDDPRIRVFKNDSNIGLTKSLNKGIRKAKGEYIARQDADDISLPNRFEKQTIYLDENPEVVLLGTSIYRIDDKGAILNKVKSISEPSFADFLESNHLKHGSTMYRKKIFNKLGGYNEFFRYSQDSELWLRFAEKYEVRNLQEHLYKFRIHNESIGHNNMEEMILYGKLARKMIKNEISDSELNDIEKNGIKQLYAYLSSKDLIESKKRIHQLRSGIFLEVFDVKSAREEYKQIFRIDPLNMVNNINIIRSFFGKNFMLKSSSLFNFLYCKLKKT